MNRKRIVIIIIAVLLVGLGVVAFQMFGENLGGSETVGQYAPGDYFVTNIKDSSRLFKTSVVLVLDTDKEESHLEEEHTRIRDTIIFILNAQDEAELRSAETPDALRDQIRNQLNQTLWEEEGHITEVLFSEYVIQ